MSVRKKRHLLKNSADDTPSRESRIQRACDQIFRAMGIVSCCRYASDSMLTPENGQPNLIDALAAAHELLGAVKLKARLADAPEAQ